MTWHRSKVLLLVIVNIVFYLAAWPPSAVDMDLDRCLSCVQESPCSLQLTAVQRCCHALIVWPLFMAYLLRNLLPPLSASQLFFAKVPPTTLASDVELLFGSFGKLAEVNLFRAWAGAKHSKVNRQSTCASIRECLPACLLGALCSISQQQQYRWLRWVPPAFAWRAQHVQAWYGSMSIVYWCSALRVLLG
jgi:hypothetical protein